MTDEAMIPDKHPTICAKCEHMLPGTHEWPTLPHCLANPGINYVTGASTIRACSVKNYGKCPDYAPAPVPPDPQADEAYGSSDTDEGVE